MTRRSWWQPDPYQRPEPKPEPKRLTKIKSAISNLSAAMDRATSRRHFKKLPRRSRITIMAKKNAKEQDARAAQRRRATS
jgi:hypothetical protein